MNEIDQQINNKFPSMMNNNPNNHTKNVNNQTMKMKKKKRRETRNKRMGRVMYTCSPFASKCATSEKKQNNTKKATTIGEN